MAQQLFNSLAQLKLVPVITLHDTAKAAPLAQALTAGGLACAEVTFRTPQAAAGIRAMTQAQPGMLVGAGTILTCEQADQAVAAGAKFIVAPGLNPTVVKHCQQLDIPVLPGCMTPTEIELALSLGLTHIKFFPAQAAGGVAMLSALSAPYGGVRFMPTGGITPNNVQSYLALSSVFACGGSWMVKEDLIQASDFAHITTLTQEAVALLCA